MKRVFLVLLLMLIAFLSFLVPSPAQRISGPHQYGYINTAGKFIIKPAFIDARPFTEGLAAVQVEEDWGYINKQGVFVIKPQYKTTGDGYGDDDQSGRPFRNGLAAVFIAGTEKSSSTWYYHCRGKWGYIDKAGNQIVEAKYDWACDFLDGKAVVFVRDRRFQIDTKGEITQDLGVEQYPICPQAQKPTPGFPRAKKIENKYGYVDESGKIVIDPIFDEAEEFSEGLAVVDVRPKKE